MFGSGAEPAMFADDDASWLEPRVDDDGDTDEDEAAADPVDVALDLARVQNRTAGQLARAVIAQVRATAGNEVFGPRQLAIAEFGAALRLGAGAATRLVDVSLALDQRLPATLAAVCSGPVSWDKAVVLAEATAALSAQQARAVEDAVLSKAPGRTWAQHKDAVMRAVARIDPDGVDARRREARNAVRLVRSHYGDGMGELFAQLPVEQLDTVYLAADMWARARKADGDTRTLDQLRVAALVQWAQSYLHHGDPSYCDQHCTPTTRESARPADAPPTRHGRRGTLQVLWDLESLLGLAARCGELTDSGATLGPQAMRELLVGGVRLRRQIIDAHTGELLDLTPTRWRLPETATVAGHGAPVTLTVVIDQATWQAIGAGTAHPRLLDAIAAAPQAVRDLIRHAWTADELDDTPDAYPVPARLAEFVAARDRHPANPSAGPTAAAAGDLDHPVPHAHGGPTVRANLASLTRRWHRLKTFGGWTVRRVGRCWQWTSPTGRSYDIHPYDYRHGP